MNAGQTLAAAWLAMAGTSGELNLAIMRKKPIQHSTILRWINRLRKAADILEGLTK